jgi:hypothetical protein
MARCTIGALKRGNVRRIVDDCRAVWGRARATCVARPPTKAAFHVGAIDAPLTVGMDDMKHRTERASWTARFRAKR